MTHRGPFQPLLFCDSVGKRKEKKDFCPAANPTFIN